MQVPGPGWTPRRERGAGSAACQALCTLCSTEHSAGTLRSGLQHLGLLARLRCSKRRAPVCQGAARVRACHGPSRQDWTGVCDTRSVLGAGHAPVGGAAAAARRDDTLRWAVVRRRVRVPELERTEDCARAMPREGAASSSSCASSAASSGFSASQSQALRPRACQVQVLTTAPQWARLCPVGLLGQPAPGPAAQGLSHVCGCCAAPMSTPDPC